MRKWPFEALLNVADAVTDSCLLLIDVVPVTAFPKESDEGALRGDLVLGWVVRLAIVVRAVGGVADKNLAAFDIRALASP